MADEPTTPQSKIKAKPDKGVSQALEKTSTPSAKDRPSALQNKYAKEKHRDSDVHIKPRNMDNWFLPSDCDSTPAHGAPAKYGKIDVDEFYDADIHAALVAVSNFAATDNEPSRYKAFVLLLSLVSRRWRQLAKRATGKESALVFTSPGSRYPSDDFLYVHVRPDFLSYESDENKLDAVIKQLEDSTMQWNDFYLPPWPVTINVGELKREQDPEPQLKTYMSTVKRYRPDLPSVYGFEVDNGEIRVAGLNACGMWISKRYPVNAIEPWVAFMSAAYYSCDHRDTRITLLKAPEAPSTFQCWKVTFASEETASVVPLHIGAAVGRSTFAALQLAECTTEKFFSGEATGFLKLSWQHKDARWKESDILKRIHEKEYLPGVVRMRHVERDVKHIRVPDQDLKRQLEIIHLGSVGEPLSQAISIRHWLFAAYDILESHLLLCEEGILHRDLSWANCLVFPRHLVKDDDKPERSRPCIAAIAAAAGIKLSPEAQKLGVKQSPVGEKAVDGAAGKSFEPCAMISDFDHAAYIEEHDLGKKTGSQDWTGTPMFIACELADPTSIEFYNSTYPLERLVAALEEIEGPKYKTAFEKSGLDKASTFKPSFKKVVDLEKARRDSALEQETPAPVNLSRFHEWRHDCESVFWWLLWGISRAQPRDGSPLCPDMTNKGSYDAFCRHMLNHVVGFGATEIDRARYINPSTLLESKLLHPAFQVLRTLFTHMAAYLAIPWFLYTDDEAVGLKPNHAHVAIRRLILVWAIREDLPFMDVLLNTERPRTADLGPKVVLRYTPSLQLRSATGASAPVSVATPRESTAQSRGTGGSRGESLAQRTSQQSRTSQKAQSSKKNKSSVVKKKFIPPLRPSPPAASSSRSRSASTSLRNGSIPGGTALRPPTGNMPTTAGSQKRPRASSDIRDDGRPSKKLKPDELVDGSETAVDVVDTPSEEATAVATPLETSESLVNDYIEAIHANMKSVYALRLKCWKDIAYWFGSGA